MIRLTDWLCKCGEFNKDELKMCKKCSQARIPTCPTRAGVQQRKRRYKHRLKMAQDYNRPFDG